MEAVTSEKADFIVALAALMFRRGIVRCDAHAQEFVDSNPGMESEMTPAKALDEWITGIQDAITP